MEYISAEEFLKQPIEVQKIFRDWWKPKENDLFIDVADTTIIECINYIEDDMITTHKDNNSFCDEDIFPLLTEGQLRKFVEDKTDSKIIVNTSLEDKYHLGFNKYCSERESGDYSGIVYCDDLLQAYWKLACEIAKESIKE